MCPSRARSLVPAMTWTSRGPRPDARRRRIEIARHHVHGHTPSTSVAALAAISASASIFKSNSDVPAGISASVSTWRAAPVANGRIGIVRREQHQIIGRQRHADGIPVAEKDDRSHRSVFARRSDPDRRCRQATDELLSWRCPFVTGFGFDGRGFRLTCVGIIDIVSRAAENERAGRVLGKRDHIASGKQWPVRQSKRQNAGSKPAQGLPCLPFRSAARDVRGAAPASRQGARHACRSCAASPSLPPSRGAAVPGSLRTSQ